VEAVKLINGKEKFQKYYKSERMAFEHFHFPEVSFRQTKKAYISFVDQEILDIDRNARYILQCCCDYGGSRECCHRHHGRSSPASNIFCNSEI
jgi:hypothetical protein